jgi:tetratricopeptide (TPR) repeat protein
MGRFSWLEFPDDRKIAAQQGARGEDDYDDAYYFQLADNSWKLGNFESALRYYARALGLNPQLEEAWFGQVVILLDLEETREARVWADKGLEKFPGSRSILSAKAMVLAKVLELAGAMELSDAAVEKKQDGQYGTKSDWFVWLARGYVLLKMGGGYSNSADFCLNKALETNPKDWFINLRVGMAYVDGGSAQKALSFIQKAQGGEIQSPLTHFTLGRCYREMGLIDLARVYYNMVAEGKSELRGAAQAAVRELNEAPFIKWIKKFRQYFSGK